MIQNTPDGAVTVKIAVKARPVAVKRRTRRGWNIRERNGRFTGDVTHPAGGKNAYETFDTWEEAERWCERTRVELRDGVKQVAREATLLKRVGDDYILSLRVAKASDGHIAQMEHALKLATAAGILDLAQDDIVEKTLKLLLGHTTQWGSPASDSSKNNLLKHLRTIAGYAVLLGRIPYNPFQRVRKIPVEISLKEVFTIDELRQCLDPRNAGHPYYRPFASMVYTGFRPGEMAQTQASWFMWDAQRLRLQIEKKKRALVAVTASGMPAKFKSGRSRIARLMHEYADIMRDHVPESGQLFPEIRALSNKMRQNRFNAFLLDCGVEVKGRTPHSCRHTWTGMMMASGENDMLVKQYAGHTEREMTEHYAQSQEEYRVQIAREGWARGELSLIAPPRKPTIISGPGARATSG